jgi:hypothetical protein
MLFGILYFHPRANFGAKFFDSQFLDAVAATGRSGAW